MSRIRWRLLASFAVLTLVVALIPALVTGIFLRHRALNNLETDLAQEARGLAVSLRADQEALGTAGFAAPGTPAGRRLQDVVRRTGRAADVRITLVDTEGRVLADSEHDPVTMANHRDRPEVAVALAGGVGRSRRASATLSTTLLYVAVPLDPGKTGAGAIRLAVPTSRVEDLLSRTGWVPLLVALAALLPVLLLTYLVARSITDPIERLRTMACSVAAGDLSYRVGTLRRDELGELGGALNEMAQSLQEQVREVADARDETEAIISSMQDGVLVVDRAGTVLRANRAVADLLDSPGPLTGSRLLHVARTFAASPVVQRALQATEATAGEVEGPGGRIFSVEAMPLTGERGDEGDLGAPGRFPGPRDGGSVLLLVRDETARRRVERMRRDFVANVSHELKTPLARLSLLASTLRHAIDEDPGQARGFSATLEGEVKGLSALVDDLLTLSRMEEQQRPAPDPTELVDLSDLATDVAGSLPAPASESAPTIELDVPGPAPVRGDRLLLETLLRNLVDNAVRYNRPGGHVWVTVTPGTPATPGLAPEEAARQPGGVTLTVADDGVGIPREHQARVFERFYRVDPARTSGGTGLGLSIVRHVAERHGATVTLTSRVGQGSTFTVQFPPTSSGPREPASRR